MFYERLREQLGRYKGGVHEPGAPTSEAELKKTEARLGRKLPKGLRELFSSWNGLRLFQDTIVIARADELAIDDEKFLRVGEALGVPLAVDERGRVFELDDEGERVLAGSTVEKWLDAVMAREGLLVDREGEFKDVFAGEGALQPEVRRKRVRAGEKADPDAAAWRVEEAELAFDEGDDRAAEAALARAVALDPDAAAAWELYGALLRRGGRAEEAAAAYASSARVTRDAHRRAERWAEAARAAAESNHEKDRAAHAAESQRAAAERPGAWLEEARALVEEGDLEGALNRATLAGAVSPTEAAPLLSQLRARRSLRVL